MHTSYKYKRMRIQIYKYKEMYIQVSKSATLSSIGSLTYTQIAIVELELYKSKAHAFQNKDNCHFGGKMTKYTKYTKESESYM